MLEAAGQVQSHIFFCELISEGGAALFASMARVNDGKVRTGVLRSRSGLSIGSLCSRRWWRWRCALGCCLWGGSNGNTSSIVAESGKQRDRSVDLYLGGSVILRERR